MPANDAFPGTAERLAQDRAGSLARPDKLPDQPWWADRRPAGKHPRIDGERIAVGLSVIAARGADLDLLRVAVDLEDA